MNVRIAIPLLTLLGTACGGTGGSSGAGGGGPGPTAPADAAPQVSSVDPAIGTTAGGTAVKLTGVFATGTTVRFGDAVAAISGSAPASISVSTPAHAAGAVDVTVAFPDGRTASLPGGFTFIAPPPAGTPPPGTPPPATVPPPATGGSGSNRFQMGSPLGLYVVDPAAGEPAVQGLVLVNLDKTAPPPDTTVTLNGVPLARWTVGTPPAPSDRYWTVDPGGPQPVVGSGGAIVLVARSGALERQLVLPCPPDVAMASTPVAGASLAGTSSLQVTWTSDLTLNPPGIPAMAGISATATLLGYDPALRAIAPGFAGQALIPAHQLGVNVPVGTTSAPAFLLDVRWPGTFVPDGETGAFCGLAKRTAYTR